MTQNDLIEKLKGIVEPYIQNREAFDAITPETDLLNDLKINSANLVDVILDIEDEFDIEIDNKSVEQMDTVGSAIDIVNKLTAK